MESIKVVSHGDGLDVCFGKHVMVSLTEEEARYLAQLLIQNVAKGCPDEAIIPDEDHEWNAES